MKVEKDKVISVHYVLQVDHEGNKVVADKSELDKPLTYLHGAGGLLPDFEAALEGLAKGDSFSFSITAERGYGVRDEAEVVQIPLDSFRDDKGNVDFEMVKAGNVLPMQDQNGNHFQGFVADVTDQFVLMDFNHPLAGKDLYFSGAVADIREASAEELSHGHVHGPGGHQH
jgi:FKBP-type peptidyl-prolyl cis-trans isomerase SlyD